MSRSLLFCWMLAGSPLAPLVAQDDAPELPVITAPDGETPTSPAPAPAPEAVPVPTVALPDRPARLVEVKVELDDELEVVRILFGLSYPKATIESRFEGQGTFQIVVPNTHPAEQMPARVLVAREGVADVLLSTQGEDLVAKIRLNTPVRCRAYAVPSEKRIVVECAYPSPPPEPPVDEPGVEFGEEEVTAEFIDTDIRVIIEALVAQSGANIMLQPGIAGNYSLSLRKVTLTQALDALWEAWGLLWLELPGKIYLIGNDEHLGERRVDVLLDIPAGWTASDLWRSLERQYPELGLRQAEATLAAGPLPIYGPLRDIGRARRWLAGLPPLADGTAPPTEPEVESLEYYPKNLSAAEATETLVTEFPALRVSADAEAGRVTLQGPRREALAARRRLLELDRPATAQVEQALWLPLLPPERIEALAARLVVELEIVYTAPDGSLIFLRGSEDKVQSLRGLVEQLEAIEARRRESTAAETATDRETVSRRYRLGSLTEVEAIRIVAATGLPVETQFEDDTLIVTGRSDRVAQVLEAMGEADGQREHYVYKVRYARTADLVRLVRGAVPELRVVDYRSHHRPGEAEAIDPRLLSPGLASPPITAPAGNDPREETEPPALGPVPPVDPLGSNPHLVLLGTQESIGRALAFLAAVDTAPAQIELTALVGELTAETVKRLGLDWTVHPFGAPSGGTRGFRFGSLVRGPYDLSAAAELIRRDPDSTLLAHPTLRTLDGEPTRLLIGRRIAFEAGPATGARSERVGVILEVVPTVPGDGSIVCRLHPEVSDLDRGPGVISRETDVTVRLRDGDTIVIGGLLEPTGRPGVRTEMVVLLAARQVLELNDQDPPPPPL